MFHGDRQNGFGCVTTLPAAAVGFAGLTDGIGPTGWLGLAELLGWFITCLVMAGLIGTTLRHAPSGIARLAAGVAGTAAGAMAYMLLNWLGLGAPMGAKIAFTANMQIIGAGGLALSALCLIRNAWVTWRS